MDNNKLILIGLIVVVFGALAFIQVTFQNQINTIVRNQDQIAERANVRGNTTSDLILEAIANIKDLQANVTRADDIRGQQFVRYLEAESDDTDEELDDLRNITLALAEHHNITLPDDVMKDSIKFENGVVTFENGTKIDAGDILSINRS